MRIGDPIEPLGGGDNIVQTFSCSSVLQLHLDGRQLHVVIEGRASVDSEVGEASGALAGNEMLPVGVEGRITLGLDRGLVVLAEKFCEFDKILLEFSAHESRQRTILLL